MIVVHRYKGLEMGAARTHQTKMLEGGQTLVE